MKKIALFLFSTALVGCAPTAQLQLSAGRIGCPMGEIVIGDVDSTSHTETWSASCRGQTFYCSGTDEFREVICKKAVSAAPAPVVAVTPPAPAVPPPVPAPVVVPVAQPVTTPAAPPVAAAEAVPAAAVQATTGEAEAAVTDADAAVKVGAQKMSEADFAP